MRRSFLVRHVIRVISVLTVFGIGQFSVVFFPKHAESRPMFVLKDIAVTQSSVDHNSHSMIFNDGIFFASWFWRRVDGYVNGCTEIPRKPREGAHLVAFLDHGWNCGPSVIVVDDVFKYAHLYNSMFSVNWGNSNIFDRQYGCAERIITKIGYIGRFLDNEIRSQLEMFLIPSETKLFAKDAGLIRVNTGGYSSNQQTKPSDNTRFLALAAAVLFIICQGVSYWGLRFIGGNVGIAIGAGCFILSAGSGFAFLFFLFPI
jgi:hypothetical protein